MGVFNAVFSTQPVAHPSPESNSVFGAFFTTFLALLSLLPVLSENEPNPIPLMAAAASLLLTLWYPEGFSTLNALWRYATGLLGRLFILLLWVFYVLPSGLLMQARGQDPLRLRFEPAAQTYWQLPPPNQQGARE